MQACMVHPKSLDHIHQLRPVWWMSSTPAGSKHILEALMQLGFSQRLAAQPLRQAAAAPRTHHAAMPPSAIAAPPKLSVRDPAWIDPVRGLFVAK